MDPMCNDNVRQVTIIKPHDIVNVFCAFVLFSLYTLVRPHGKSFVILFLVAPRVSIRDKKTAVYGKSSVVLFLVALRVSIRDEKDSCTLSTIKEMNIRRRNGHTSVSLRMCVRHISTAYTIEEMNISVQHVFKRCVSQWHETDIA